MTISGAGCKLPGEQKPLSGRIASGVVRLFVRHVIEAKQRELDVVIASGLDWVAPRPPRVIEGPGTGQFKVGVEARGMAVTQGDLARFMVDQLTDDTHLRTAPYISNY